MAVARQQPTLIERRAGRFSAEERESAKAFGRTLHWIEDRLCEWQRLLSLFFSAHERETLLDRELDGRVRTAIVHLDAGNGLEARALLLEYLERDALRDAEHHAQRGFVSGMHGVLRQFGAFVERSAAALTRSRPRRAQAAQLGLLEDA
jgi:hypothetical protein